MSVSRIEVNRILRGHVFFGSELASTPSLYETEDIDTHQKVITAHFFFSAGSNWYVSEFDPKTGEIFGYCVLNGDMVNAEWGYASLFELESIVTNVNGLPVVIERDLDWTPTRFGDIRFTE